MTDRTLRLTAASKIAPNGRLDRWGGWILDDGWLRYPAYGRGRSTYDVGLDRLTSLYEVVDFIDHISRKVWATDACLAGFVRAIGDTVRPARTMDDR